VDPDYWAFTIFYPGFKPLKYVFSPINPQTGFGIPA
jgi:hypothetical protein